MPLVLVLSSHVAGSRVGGGIAPFVLAPLKVDPVVLPTTLLGRHPGWGAPGGGPVSVETLQGMIEGVSANGLLELTDALVTGYFASVEQVLLAASLIDRLRDGPHVQAHSASRERPLIVVDPIMGDEGPGLYVQEAVADAIVRELVPRADIVAPNLWEFRRIFNLGDKPIEPAGIAPRARANGAAWLVSSVRQGDRIGAVYADAGQAWFAHSPFVSGPIPHGSGDLLTLAFVGRLVSGLAPRVALAQAAGATHAVIDRAKAWNAPELPLSACQDVLADPPIALIEALSS